MHRLFALVAVPALLINGCGGRKVDNDPTIFGFTPALRTEMRELIAASDPKADPDKVVNEYMDSLKTKLAKDVKAKPNAAGDYVLPPEQEQQIVKSIGMKKPGSMRPIVTEFISNPPSWVESLVAEEESGRITPEHYEILIRWIAYSMQMGQAK